MAGTPYTDKERSEALQLYTTKGTAHAAKTTGINPRTIRRWAHNAGLVTEDATQKTSEARAQGAMKIAQTWSDFRESEALAAGNAANRARQRFMDAIAGRDSQLIRALAISYGIMVDKAEQLSGQASARVEVWAETEVDRELRDAMAEMEKVVRDGVRADADA